MLAARSFIMHPHVMEGLLFLAIRHRDKVAGIKVCATGIKVYAFEPSLARLPEFGYLGRHRSYLSVLKRSLLLSIPGTRYNTKLTRCK